VKLSDVPKGWTLAQLDDVRAEGEYTFVGGPFGSDLTQRDYVSDGVPVIRGTNLGGTEGRFVDDGFVFVTKRKAQSLRKNMAFPGDILFTQRGTLGQVAVIPKSARFGQYVISQSQMKLTPHPSKADSRFLYHYFRAPRTLNRLLAQTQATGVPHINLGILKRFPVTLPPVPEQRRVADILDTADGLRAKRLAVLEQLNGLTQAMFLEMFGDPAANQKAWPIVPISNLLVSACYGTSEKAGAVGAFPILRMGNVTSSGEIDATDLKFIDLRDCDIEKYTVRVGDVLFNRTNSPDLVGKSAIVRTMTVPMAFAGYLIRLRVNDENSPEYLSAFLNTAYAKRMLRAMCKAIIGMANINATEIQRMMIPQPPLALQQQFARWVRQVEKVKASHRASLSLNDTLFASLQHRAFGGAL
jgi:type I restriction enzyme S subunit